MDIQHELVLSYYKDLSPLNNSKKVYIVQHIETNKLYVKKILDIYNIDIYNKLKTLSIKGIPQVYECFEDDGLLYVIEEYIHGKTLEEAMNEHSPLSEDLCIDVLEQLCSILSELHALTPAIIHRDIKPSNLILTADNTLKLVDFNAAKYYTDNSSQDTVLLGTHHFAAPEQYGFSQSDVRTDIYGLGVTVNYLLTGKYPNDCIYEGSLHDILEHCLKMNPAERYSSCEEILEALKILKGTNRKSSNKRLIQLCVGSGVAVIILLILGIMHFAMPGKVHSTDTNNSVVDNVENTTNNNVDSSVVNEVEADDIANPNDDDEGSDEVINEDDKEDDGDIEDDENLSANPDESDIEISSEKETSADNNKNKPNSTSATPTPAEVTPAPTVAPNSNQESSAQVTPADSAPTNNQQSTSEQESTSNEDDMNILYNDEVKKAIEAGEQILYGDDYYYVDEWVDDWVYEWVD